MNFLDALAGCKKIEVDKFMFLCHKHHMEEHGKKSHPKRFASSGKQDFGKEEKTE